MLTGQESNPSMLTMATVNRRVWAIAADERLCENSSGGVGASCMSEDMQHCTCVSPAMLLLVNCLSMPSSHLFS